MNEIEVAQRQLCKTYDADYYPSHSHQKIGIANDIVSGIMPVNGLRHLPAGGANGWYIWAGKEMSLDDDYFKPFHLSHLQEISPDLLKFLGLPPGWRFLVAPGYEDVWYDPSLLVE